MGLKSFKPTSPGRRFMTVSDFKEITRKAPEKGLLESKKSSGGRSDNGRVAVRYRGGGHKRKYRRIDFKRDKTGVPAIVAAIEYDPNRSARIALLHYADGVKSYILAPKGLEVGAEVLSSPVADIKPGNCLPLKNIPAGTDVHNIEMKIGKGGAIARAAGTTVQLMAKEGEHALLKMPSGELRRVNSSCRATIGQVGNEDHERISIGKAGRKRWLGRRPKVRGVAMNPVDHPHGGGEGKSSGGRHPVTPWGFPTKGKKTRDNRRTQRLIVKRRK